MFIIGKVIIEESVAHARFACDLQQCKGACCTMPGGRGAPLQDEEVAELEQAYPYAKQYLSEKSIQAIEQHGMYEGTDGGYATSCVDDRDCVFVFYEENIARCSLEKAFRDGKTNWQKPLSCHLFPIRISAGESARVRYETIAECIPGRTLGQHNDIPLYEYLKEPLVRKFGQSWYENFHAECICRDGVPAKEKA